MNNAALAIADSALLNFPTVTLNKGQVLYHGARSIEEIVGLRPNAMFTSDLFYAVDYAFKRDRHAFNGDGSVSWRNDLYRSLFCCTLEKNVDLVEITGVDWPRLCYEISKADVAMPKYDGWLQENLTSYLSDRYGNHIEGAILLSGSNSDLDEYIFKDANSVFSIHRRID